MLSFVLPKSCPNNVEVSYTSIQLEELPPTDESTPPAKKVQKVVNTPVVDSDVKRSLRIREKKMVSVNLAVLLKDALLVLPILQIFLLLRSRALVRRPA
jgi:hypothetical protein